MLSVVVLYELKEQGEITVKFSIEITEDKLIRRLETDKGIILEEIWTKDGASFTVPNSSLSVKLLNMGYNAVKHPNLFKVCETENMFEAWTYLSCAKKDMGK